MTTHRFTTLGLCSLALWAAAAATAPAPAAPAELPAAATKRAAPGTRLLLPLYEVDAANPNGATTIFAVRNELDVPAEIEIRYFRTNSPQAPQRSDRLTLSAKQVLPTNIRFVQNLQVDEDGVARGYVVVEAVTAGAVIQGDHFQVTPGEDFATGARLLNIDAASVDDDRCNLFTMRFLNGGGFDSGTVFTVWVDLDLPPGPDPILAIAAYDEPGNLLLARTVFADEVAFRTAARDLLQPISSEDFGAVEFQFLDDRVGHVSAVLSAAGRYSVGLEASCGDP